MTTLVICEKPQAAEKIAKALGDVETLDNDGVKYYKADGNYVVPAVGHLFTLDNINNDIPIFSVEWKPTFVVHKDSLFSKKYYKTLKIVAKKCDDFIIACDYDVEGSVIGYNILRFICEKRNAKRMKFSTLTEKELKESYKNVKKNINMGMVNSGLCRHYLDFYYGVNISRMLTDALKRTGKVFQIMSTGRVQGPTLSILAKREREIMQFKPEPYWQVKMDWDDFFAFYENKQIWDEKETDKIISDCKGKDAVVDEVKKHKKRIKPPHPFDLTSLQVEAYGAFKYSPSRTLKIAQNLYTKAYISYPRTSSQKLPASIGLNEIISDLKKQGHYKKFCEQLLKKDKLVPNEGKKGDPAHPAIYPTGEVPENLTRQEKHIYDLVVRRFLACFAGHATRESVQIFFDISNHKFESTGSKTIKSGWIEIMDKYVNYTEVKFPDLKKGEKVKVKSLEKIEKETEPPNRYSQGSIMKELEKRGLGTKATRANILQTLYNRNYISGRSIHVTKLGFGLFEVLDNHCKTIISEKLTREFEVDMEKISSGETRMEDILTKAKIVVREIVDDFKQHEIDVGRDLTSAVIAAREEKRTLGKCGKCGGHLKIMFSRRTKKKFVGCDNYPDCKNSFPLPSYGLIKKTDKVCEKCGTPIIYVFRRGKRPFKMCLDTECETKADWGKKKKKKGSKSDKKRVKSDKKRSSDKKDQKK